MTEFVDGWVLGHTLGEGSYGEYVYILFEYYTKLASLCYPDDVFSADSPLLLRFAIVLGTRALLCSIVISVGNLIIWINQIRDLPIHKLMSLVIYLCVIEKYSEENHGVFWNMFV